jgi:hypothetical protein
MCTVLSVFPSCLLVAVVLWAGDQGAIAVKVDVIEQVASLDLFVASLELVRTPDDKVIQNVEQEL